MATTNFGKTLQYYGDGTRIQFQVVQLKAGKKNTVEPVPAASAATARPIGVLFEVNTKDGDPVGVVVERNCRIALIADSKIDIGDDLTLSTTDAGYVKKGTTNIIAKAETAALEKGDLVEATWLGA